MKMKGIVITADQHLELADLPRPELRAGHVIIRVKAAGVNRADLLQKAGTYPPPPGWPDWPGLECSGEIAEAASGSRWHVGDKVCALLGGGGYAEFADVPEDMVMPIPRGYSFEEAAAIPETYATVYLNLVRLAGLKAGDTLFIQAGASGLGLSAIQLAKVIGAKIVTTVGSDEKAEMVKKFGADIVINRKKEDVVVALTAAAPDVALDCAGGAILGPCLDAMKPGGRWILIATLGGTTTEINLRVMLKKHLRLMGSTLRSRSDEEKGDILRTLVEQLWPSFEKRAITPVINACFPYTQANEAHAVLEAQKNIGKVVITF
ncbi:MAG: NAD(P)H-quinone oxidoreductase [Victivallales bacterium]|nr:NAD(P)H-quinone oxidoreductase [Victivallales bacterium]